MNRPQGRVDTVDLGLDDPELSVRKVRDIFNSRHISRDIPLDPHDIEEAIRRAILSHMPIPLVGFWWVWEKVKIETSDMKAIKFLEDKVAKRVEMIHREWVKYDVILADEHGRSNGIPEETIQSYYDSLSDTLDPNLFQIKKLSDIWNRRNISREKIDAIFQETGLIVLDKADELHMKQWWVKYGKKSLKEELIRRASLHNHGCDPEEAAAKYVIMRMMLEKWAIAQEFPDHIFHSYASRDEALLLPDLSKVYLWSTKSGRSNPPWFEKN